MDSWVTKTEVVLQARFALRFSCEFLDLVFFGTSSIRSLGFPCTSLTVFLVTVPPHDSHACMRNERGANITNTSCYFLHLCVHQLFNTPSPGAGGQCSLQQSVINEWGLTLKIETNIFPIIGIM
jgi:hypothetical protein